MRPGAVLAVATALCGCRFGFESVPELGCPDPQGGLLVTEPPSKYVSPTGSNGNPGTIDLPWGTIAYALVNAPVGDHIVLLDGQYIEPLIVNTNNRTVRAMNDGKAVFDGGGTITPCEVSGSGNVVEGVHCRDGFPAVVNLASATSTIVRRVTADTAPSAMVFRVQGGSDNLLEDVAAWGPASLLYSVFGGTRITLRRCFARFDGSDDMYSSALVLADNTVDSRVENCVIRTTVPDDPVLSVVGINLFSSAGQVDRNTIAGTVVYGFGDWAAVVGTETSRIEGNHFVDTVLLKCGGGLYQRSDANIKVERMTAVDFNEAGAYVVDAHATEPKDANFSIGGSVSQSVLGRAPQAFNVYPEYVMGFSHAGNTVFAVDTPWMGTTPDPTEEIYDPAYDTDRYGLGAYLIRNDRGTGAEILYRYDNGVVTDEPLWPWPLEGRILRDSGSSVTFESGGGIWRELPEQLLTPDCP